MNRKLFCISVISFSLTASLAGCSSVSNKQAHGNFDYAEKNEAAALTIPDGLQKPKQKSNFYVPEVANSNAPIGKAVDVRAPALVIPVAAGSRIEGNAGDAQVWFDQVIDDKDLLDFIRDALKSQLTTDGVALTPVSSDNLVFESDWYIHEKEDGFWLMKEIVETEKMRYKYTLEAKPHGRSVAIKVDLIDYSKKDPNGTVTDMNPIDKHRVEMAMLNTLIGEVDYQYRIYKHELLQSKANKTIVTIGNNKQDEPAFIVDMELDSLWTSVPAFFSDNGFEVTDLNESKHIYYVDFVKPESGFWGSMWGDDKPVIDLTDGKYKFVFSELDDKTAVTLLDEDGVALPSEKLETMLPIMEPGLSFNNLFQED